MPKKLFLLILLFIAAICSAHAFLGSKQPPLRQDTTIMDETGKLTDGEKKTMFLEIEKFFQDTKVPIFVVMQESLRGKKLEEAERSIIREKNLDEPYKGKAILITCFWKDNVRSTRYGTKDVPVQQRKFQLLPREKYFEVDEFGMNVQKSRPPSTYSLGKVEYGKILEKEVDTVIKAMWARDPLQADITGAKRTEKSIASGGTCLSVLLIAVALVVVVVVFSLLKSLFSRTPRGVAPEYDTGGSLLTTPGTVSYSSADPLAFQGTDTPFTSETPREPRISLVTQNNNETQHYPPSTAMKPPSKPEQMESPWGSSDESGDRDTW